MMVRKTTFSLIAEVTQLSHTEPTTLNFIYLPKLKKIGQRKIAV